MCTFASSKLKALDAKQIIIIGGGAAGFFAAINCAENYPDYKVLLVEKGAKGLTKVRISGGGRCNLTNACFDNNILVKNYPRGEKELRNVFSRFSTNDTINWFEKRGVKLKTEDDALEFLRSRYEKDEWGLATELQKIGTMGEGIRSRKEIEPLDAAETPNFFGLLGGLKSQRLAERLTALERIFASREPAVKFFNVLAYGGPEYLRRFAEYDVMIKSGKLEYDEALLDSVL